MWFANAERIAPISAMELWEQLPGRRRHRADGEFKLKRRRLIKGGKLVVSHIRQKKNLTVIDPHGPGAEEWVCRKLEWRWDQNHFSLICWSAACAYGREILVECMRFEQEMESIVVHLHSYFIFLCCFISSYITVFVKWTFYVSHLIFDSHNLKNMTFQAKGRLCNVSEWQLDLISPAHSSPASTVHPLSIPIGYSLNPTGCMWRQRFWRFYRPSVWRFNKPPVLIQECQRRFPSRNSQV